MCDRYRPANGADSEDPRPSLARVMERYEAARREIDRGNVGAVVLILRGLSDEERDLVEELLLADDPPPDPEPPWRAIAHSDRGQALVEFALILPILLLLVVGVAWASLCLLQASRLDHLAREAAVAGAQEPPAACEAAEAAVDRLADTEADFACELVDDVVVVTLTGSMAVPPPLDALTGGDLVGRGSAIIRGEEETDP